MKSHFFAVAAVAIVAGVSPVLAQVSEPVVIPGPPGARPATNGGGYNADSYTIGIGGGVAATYDGSGDYQFQPGGLLRGSVSGFEFAARGPNLYVDLLREKRGETLDLVAGPVIALRLERNNNIDDARVALLGRRKAALEIGGYVGIGKRGLLNPFDKLSADVTVVTDVSGVHRGTIVRPTVSYFTPLSRKTFALISVGGEHVSENYGRTYFDVAPIAAAGALPAYQVQGGGFKTAGITLLGGRALGRNPLKGWSVFALAGYTRVLGKYARSPIVAIAGERGQGLGVAGIAYSF